MTNKLGYNPHIDGLRGIAILMVMGYHYFSGLYIFDFGWSGVDLFFVISGYLLTGRLYPYVTDKKLLIKFYWNRFLRIVPLSFAFLTLFFLLAYFWTLYKPTNEFDIYFNDAPYFFLFLTNWVYVKHIAINYIYVGPLWSLSVEEQFYLIFPWVFILIKNKKTLLKIGVAFVVTILIARCTYLIYFLEKDTYIKVYFNSFCRADSFLMGFVLYMAIENGLYARIEKMINTILLVACTILVISIFLNRSAKVNPFFETIGFTILAIIYSCLVFQANASKNYFLKRVTNKTLFLKTGKVSFGLYIFHWPTYLVLFSLLLFIFNKLQFKTNTITFKVIHIFLSITISYLLSILSFKYYESFFLKFKRKPTS